MAVPVPVPESGSGSGDAATALPPLAVQAERLIELGVPGLAGISAAEMRAFAAGGGDDVLLAVHPDRAPASALAPLLRREGKSGFVVADMHDVDRFAPHRVELPDAPLYLVAGPDRGDRMSNWSPDEALPVLTGEGRSPLVLTEGIHWVLQQPAVLDRNHCFMTIGSRLVKANGALDARTPAIWISNGTGRDGRERRNAPKVGWCWWNNRHTWLGFASAADRRAQSAEGMPCAALGHRPGSNSAPPGQSCDPPPWGSLPSGGAYSHAEGPSRARRAAPLAAWQDPAPPSPECQQ